jgi:hypothetical protein
MHEDHLPWRFGASLILQQLTTMFSTAGEIAQELCARAGLEEAAQAFRGSW